MTQRPYRALNVASCIGEIDFDAEVILPTCGYCANPMPEGDDILYAVSAIKNNPEKLIIAG